MFIFGTLLALFKLCKNENCDVNWTNWTCIVFLRSSIANRASYSAGARVAAGCPPVEADHGLWMRTVQSSDGLKFPCQLAVTRREPRDTLQPPRPPGLRADQTLYKYQKIFYTPATCRRTCWDQTTVNKIINIGIMSLSCVEWKT